MTKEEERSKVVDFTEALVQIYLKEKKAATTNRTSFFLDGAITSDAITEAITQFYQQLKFAGEIMPFKYMSDSEIKATIAETVKWLYEANSMNELKFRGIKDDGQIVTGGGIYQSHGQLFIVADFTFIAVRQAVQVVGCDEQGRDIYKGGLESK